MWICTCAYIITPVVLQIQTPKRTKLNIAARNKVTQPLFKKQSLHTSWCRASVKRSRRQHSAQFTQTYDDRCVPKPFLPPLLSPILPAVIEGVFSRVTGRLATQITRLSRGNVFAPPPLQPATPRLFLPERALALFSCQARQPRALVRCVLWHVSSQTEQWVGPRGRLKSGGRTFLEQNSWYNKYGNHTHKWRPFEYHFSSMLKNWTKLNVPLLNSFFSVKSFTLWWIPKQRAVHSVDKLVISPLDVGLIYRAITFVLHEQKWFQSYFKQLRTNQMDFFFFFLL